ncbi:MAG: hypothetical protein QXS79_06800 [Candidatus Bathyarchaeia archaeon]
MVKAIVEDAYELGVSKIVLGKLEGIRIRFQPKIISRSSLMK